MENAMMLGLRGCTAMDANGVCTVFTPDTAPAFDWSAWTAGLIGGATKTVEGILTAKNQTKGILTQTAPGVYTYVQPEGSQVTLPIGTSQVVSATGSTGMGMILLAGAGVFLVFMLAKGKG
jgi:hypothetical protein